MQKWIELDVDSGEGYTYTVAELGPYPMDTEESFLASLTRNVIGLTGEDLMEYGNIFPWHHWPSGAKVVETYVSVQDN